MGRYRIPRSSIGLFAMAVALGLAISGCSNEESRQVGEFDYHGACWKTVGSGRVEGVRVFASDGPGSEAERLSFSSLQLLLQVLRTSVIAIHSL